MQKDISLHFVVVVVVVVMFEEQHVPVNTCLLQTLWPLPHPNIKSPHTKGPIRRVIRPNTTLDISSLEADKKICGGTKRGTRCEGKELTKGTNIGRETRVQIMMTGGRSGKWKKLLQEQITSASLVSTGRLL